MKNAGEPFCKRGSPTPPPKTLRDPDLLVFHLFNALEHLRRFHPTVAALGSRVGVYPRPFMLSVRICSTNSCRRYWGAAPSRLSNRGGEAVRTMLSYPVDGHIMFARQSLSLHAWTTRHEKPWPPWKAEVQNARLQSGNRGLYRWISYT